MPPADAGPRQGVGGWSVCPAPGGRGAAEPSSKDAFRRPPQPMLRRGRVFLRTRLPSSDIHEARARRGRQREERVRKRHGPGGGGDERARGSRATLLPRAGPPSRRRTHSVGGLGKEGMGGELPARHFLFPRYAAESTAALHGQVRKEGRRFCTFGLADNRSTFRPTMARSRYIDRPHI